ncbi:MAG: hypothetical protein JW943_10430 [Deltaproteobacteria bacterium]|nr:hypothetical protein [Deltaproteobacteria bacterium]
MNDHDTGPVKEVDFEPIRVACYGGYKAHERPVAFTYLECRQEVLEILDRWYDGGVKPDEPVVAYFKVRTSEGKVYLLRYDSDLDAWSIHRKD